MNDREFDRILIEGLKFHCIIGINDWERVAKQVIEIGPHAARRSVEGRRESDDVSDTVNYKDVSRKVRDFAEESSFGLVEKLADGVARLCLEDDRVERVDVRLRKPGALRLGRSVGLDITPYS